MSAGSFVRRESWQLWRRLEDIDGQPRAAVGRPTRIWRSIARESKGGHRPPRPCGRVEDVVEALAERSVVVGWAE
jgi:hypothetical protein